MRLGVEKIKKQCGAKKITKEQKDTFKAELYIFLQKKLQTCLDLAVNETQRQVLHSDIVQQFRQLQMQQEDKVYESFNESQEQKYERLAQEFDTVCDL